MSDRLSSLRINTPVIGNKNNNKRKNKMPKKKRFGEGKSYKGSVAKPTKSIKSVPAKPSMGAGKVNNPNKGK